MRRPGAPGRSMSGRWRSPCAEGPRHYPWDLGISKRGRRRADSARAWVVRACGVHGGVL